MRGYEVPPHFIIDSIPEGYESPCGVMSIGLLHGVG